jgi:hypothetical protein
MASTSYGSFSWVGDDFDPGVEHYWSSTPADFGTVVSITAHAVARLDREIAVKDVRTHVDSAGHRSMYFTVRNTGSNNISGYALGFSYVKQ